MEELFIIAILSQSIFNKLLFTYHMQGEAKEDEQHQPSSVQILNMLNQPSNTQPTKIIKHLTPEVPSQHAINDKALYIKSLQKKQIWMDDGTSQDQMKIQIVKSSNDWRMLQITASYKKFTFNKINISINEYISGAHLIEDKSKGFYGTTYFMKVNKRRCAVKCIPIGDEESFENTFKQALKEYLLLKIASALQAGPLLETNLGFDIFVHYDCIEFGMELCQISKEYSAQSQSQLKDSLSKLHLLNLIHHDIKPYNICYSPTFKKHVFIDFGLSQITDSQKHQKVYTGFRGTFDYCSDQMKKAFLLGNFNVNLYQNDKCMLDKTLKQLKQLPIKQKKVNFIYQELDGYYSLYLIQFYLFNNDSDSFRQILAFFRSLCRQKQWNRFAQQMLKSLLSLPFSDTNKFLIQILKRQSKDQTLQKINLILFHKMNKMTIIVQEQNQKNEIKQQVQLIFQLIFKEYLLNKQSSKKSIEYILDKELFQFQNISENYFVIVAKYISFQSTMYTYPQKANICMVFCQNYMKISPKSQSQAIETTLRYMYQFCEKGLLDEIKIQVLQELIASFLMIQILDKDKFLALFRKYLSQCRQIDSLKLLVIRFLSAVYWLNGITIQKEQSYLLFIEQTWSIFINYVNSYTQEYSFKNIMHMLITFNKITFTNKIFILNYPKKHIDKSSTQYYKKLADKEKKILEQWDKFDCKNTPLNKQILFYGFNNDLQIINKYYQKICEQCRYQSTNQFYVEAKQLIFHIILLKTRQCQTINHQNKKLSTQYFYYNMELYCYFFQFHLNNKRTKNCLKFYIFTKQFLSKYENTGQYVYISKLFQKYCGKYPFYYKHYLFMANLASENVGKQILDKEVEGLVYIYNYVQLKIQDIKALSIYQKFIQYMCRIDFQKNHLMIQQICRVILANRHVLYRIIQKYYHRDWDKNKYFLLRLRPYIHIRQQFEKLNFIVLFITKVYPTKGQQFARQVMNYSFHQDIVFQAKFQVKFEISKLQLQDLLKRNQYEIGWNYFVEMGISLIKMFVGDMILSLVQIMVKQCKEQKIKTQAVGLLAYYSVHLNSKLIGDIFYQQQLHPIFNYFMLILFKQKEYYFIKSIIKNMGEVALIADQLYYVETLITKLSSFHQQIQKYFVGFDLKQVYEKQYFNVIMGQNNRNSYLSFYFIVLLDRYSGEKSQFKQKYDIAAYQHRMYSFICQSFDQLVNPAKDHLRKYFYYLIKPRQEKRYNRNIRFKFLKYYSFVDDRSLLIQKAKKCIKSIIKPKNKYKKFYSILLGKLQIYYCNTLSSSVVNLIQRKNMKLK